MDGSIFPNPAIGGAITVEGDVDVEALEVAVAYEVGVGIVLAATMGMVAAGAVTAAEATKDVVTRGVAVGNMILFLG